jgi:hypothetical protein
MIPKLYFLPFDSINYNNIINVKNGVINENKINIIQIINPAAISRSGSLTTNVFYKIGGLVKNSGIMV